MANPDRPPPYAGWQVVLIVTVIMGMFLWLFACVV
jgi:hypothetical protein